MSSRYYNFAGSPHHYAYDWSGVAMPSVRAAETRALGYSGYAKSTGPYAHHFPALADWPPVRPSGPEPGAHDMVGWGRADLGVFGEMSRNEKRLVLLLGAGALAWYMLRKKRRNPPRRRYGKAVGKAAVFRKRSRAAKKGWRRRR